MAPSSQMNGGDGNNSNLQGYLISLIKKAINKAVVEHLEIGTSLSGSGPTAFVIADLGCAVGPGTFYTVQAVIDAVRHKCGQEALEFLVLFNDRIGNDFNALFASLPHPRGYLAAGVPGSFYGRLFPSSSVHVAYSSNTVVWLSEAPEGLQIEGSPSWNAGRIHYTGASDAVVKTYEDRFEEDMEVFLGWRGREIGGGGMLMLLLPCVPQSGAQHHACSIFTFIDSILIDMVKEGVVGQEQVDSFNMLIFIPRIEDMRRVIDKNGSFEIVKMERIDVKPAPDPEALVSYMRIMLGETFTKHFGKETVDRVFAKVAEQKLELVRSSFVSSGKGEAEVLFVAMKRKN